MEQIEQSAESVPYETRPDEIIVRIEAKHRNPHVGRIASVTLKGGKQTYKFATVMEILNNDQQHHHFQLDLETWNRTKKNGWVWKEERCFTLDNADEIGLLANFLQPVLSGQLPDSSGQYQLIERQRFERLSQLVAGLRGTNETRRVRLLTAILRGMESGGVSGDGWLKVFETGGTPLLETVSAASRLVEYRRAYDDLVGMVSRGEMEEQAFQAHLAKNPWMFGSEYSSLEPRRNWVRDDRFDYMLRRTVDEYLEIVEIKTPIAGDLFLYDESHDSYYARSELSKVVGQVVRYIEQIDAERFAIHHRDDVDPLKIRARIIIGRDGSHAKNQGAALRNFNAHLHRIEVLTFDQLCRMARRVLDVFEDAISSSGAARGGATASGGWISRSDKSLS